MNAIKSTKHYKDRIENELKNTNLLHRRKQSNHVYKKAEYFIKKIYQ